MDICDDDYELFRRAVVDRDAEAWAMIAERYRPLLVTWARRCRVAEITGELYEDLADEGLARAWRALAPERFAGFPSLAALLGYLRACVTATVIDAARARLACDHSAQCALGDGGVSPDQIVLERLQRDELWKLVGGVITSEMERVVLIERFVFDLPPRVIQGRHPTLFPDVEEIYGAIRNLRDRLRRHKDLRQFYTDHLAA